MRKEKERGEFDMDPDQFKTARAYMMSRNFDVNDLDQKMRIMRTSA
jgi:hypothetical protein